ncbi:MAG: hypothetical protein HZR80_20795 [Candidatus Heimdallarchaeota archaeon]
MHTKKGFQKKIEKIIKDKYSNWEEKSIIIDKWMKEEENSEEYFIDLVLKHRNPKIRKGVASILFYLDYPVIAEQLVGRILIEPDWTVRYALSKACTNHLGKNAVENLNQFYYQLLAQSDDNRKYQLRKIFAENLGIMGLKEGIPNLVLQLKEVGNHRDKYSVELIMQILYSLGEIGDKSAINLLLKYSAKNVYSTEGIINSALHAIDKIAKRLGFSSKKALLEDINRNQN